MPLLFILGSVHDNIDLLSWNLKASFNIKGSICIIVISNQ